MYSLQCYCSVLRMNEFQAGFLVIAMLSFDFENNAIADGVSTYCNFIVRSQE